MHLNGTVTDIFITPEPEGKIFGVESIEAVAGVGLKGDRNYYKQIKLPAEERKPENECTLVELESIEELIQSGEFGTLQPGDLRRNLVTKNIRLNDLVGRVFTIGEVTAKGIELCEPCRHLEKLTGKKIMKPLVHKAGLRAQIIHDGMIYPGDEIKVSQ